jgi:hypothetical protein
MKKRHFMTKTENAYHSRTFTEMPQMDIFLKNETEMRRKEWIARGNSEQIYL